MLIKNGVIHTMDGPVIQRGYVWVEGSRISGVGDMDSLAETELLGPVVDAQGGHVLPGFIDAHCHLGFSGDEMNEGADPCTPQLRGLDGVDPMDEYFAQARKAGVTCVVTGPGSANPIGGQMVVLKTVGIIADQMVVRQPGAMKFALGENPMKGHGRGQGAAPQTRMATAALIREQLAKAAEYGQKLERAEERGGDSPEFDTKLEALAPVAAGRVPAHFHAHRADDIATAVRIAKEFGLDLTIVHGTDGPLIAEFLARAGVPVITGPSLTDKSKSELKNLAMENTAALARAGVQVAICTDHPETPIQYLPLCAALAAQAGMDEEEALAAITINAACIAGVDDRLGSLTIGKDADIVITSRHPFELKSRVQAVWIDGREVTL
jgi:imidazolonepropionase-like amidohydrolase